MNKLDPFEKFLNAKLQGNEVEFSYESWDAIEKKLPSTPISNLYYLIGAVIIIGAITSSIIYLNNIPENNNEVPAENNYQKNSNKSSDNKEMKKENKESITNLNLEEEENKEINTIELKYSDKSTNLDPKATAVNTKEDQFSKNNNESSVKENLTFGPWELPKDKTAEHIEKITLTSDFTCSNNNTCIEDIIYFNAIHQENTTYLWDFDDGNYSDLHNPEHQYNSPGIYLVQLTVSDNFNPSNTLNSREYQIIVNDKPSTEIALNTFEENGIPFIQFTQNNNNNQSIIWDFGDGSTSIENNPIHRYLHKGTYKVILLITDLNNCSNTISRSINIDQTFNLLAPNSFTPNGDGINDYFIPESLKIMDVEFTMTIFNKLGKRVYQSKNINQPWDGFNQNNGQKCQEGNYMWVVQLINKKGETEQYKGAILLLN